MEDGNLDPFGSVHKVDGLMARSRNRQHVSVASQSTFNERPVSRDAQLHQQWLTTMKWNGNPSNYQDSFTPVTSHTPYILSMRNKSSQHKQVIYSPCARVYVQLSLAFQGGIIKYRVKIDIGGQ